MKNIGVLTLIVLYHMGALGTAIFLFFFATNWTWWNWILVIPLTLFLAEIWPIYWLITLIRGQP